MSITLTRGQVALVWAASFVQGAQIVLFVHFLSEGKAGAAVGSGLGALAMTMIAAAVLVRRGA